MNRIELARLFALLTTDTGIAATAHGNLANIMRRTTYIHALFLIPQFNKMIWTGFCTLTAGNTLFCAEHRNAIANGNDIVITHRNTVGPVPDSHPCKAPCRRKTAWRQHKSECRHSPLSAVQPHRSHDNATPVLFWPPQRPIRP